MSWSKKAAVLYHFIESVNSDFFSDIKMAFNSLLGSTEPFGSFESGETRFYWKINGKENITKTDTYFVSLVKEKKSWPVWFNENGNISEIPLSDGSLGELYYAIINPEEKFMLSTAALTGSPVGAYKKFLNEFSKDGSIKLMPLFENRIDVKTLSWDYYKKVSASINFPNVDEIAEFLTTKEGTFFNIIDEVGGLKIDFTVTAPKQNQKLNLSQTREIVKALLPNDYCTKLVLKGADDSSESIEEFDIKNAQVKYKELVEISGSYMSEDEALILMKRAFNDRSKELLNLVE